MRGFSGDTHVYLLTCDRYSAGPIAPTAKPLNAVTNLPKTKSINGSNVPEAIAATNAMMLSTHVVRSAYPKTRQ
jgi:hypothetical protein